ncbi:T9SS type A sorting domain-containing protein [Flavobacterium sp.]|uniref:alpha/beta hydrolase n=1 Tax=Flavobacterium sp. TaxID=239 RepID=UPI00286D7819|nr:T9SS type A sorting domain-containing protein [Flavobacterium sp.]
MKNNILKKLWFLCLFVAISTSGQTTITGLKKDYTQSMDSLLLNINKQSITTGILHERIMNFANLDALKANGAITNSNYNHFLQSWSELYRAAYNPTFISSDNLKNNLNAYSTTSAVDIGIINTKMNVIKSGNASTPSLKFENGRFANIVGVNPFTENQVTVIAALKEEITANTITFRLQPSFMLQLLGKKIKNLTVNFGTGTVYNLIANQIIATTKPIVTFTTSGEKEFVYTVTFDDNTTQTLKSKMTVNIVATNPDTLRSGVFPAEENFVGINGVTATIPFQGYNEATASLGKLEYRTYYNTVSNSGYNVTTNTFSVQPKIRKTVIILDGFDPGDGRKIYPGSIGYKSDKSSLEELMLFKDETGVDRNLVTKLRNAPYGFDVTLVNFPAGADYVERNAMALVALFQRENAKLASNGSTEQISIIGPSMGGLVARYALAYMEKNNIPHNTKLFVSFDSPHLGANIPISTQENLYFFGYYGQKEKAKQKFDENFRSPAARQMLTEQLDGVQQNFPYTANLWFSPFNGQNNNTRFRNLFNANLASNGLPNSNGFPQNLRKIAIINGTGNGAKTNSEGLTCLQLEAFKTIKWFQIFGTSATTTLKVVTIDDRFLATTNNLSQTFSGKITFPGKLGQIFGTTIPGQPSVINGWVFRINSNPRGSMDVVQGGLFNTMDIIYEEFSNELYQSVLDKDLTYFNWPINLHKHAFIPSVSALAFKNPNFNWSTAFNRNLVCDPVNKEIPFDSYFIPPTNEDHVKVTVENANWLIKELQGIPQAPYFPIQPNQLNGSSAVCFNTNSVQTLLNPCNVPSAVVYNDQNGNPVNGWSVQGNISIVASTAYSVTVKGTSSAIGSGKIIATFQNGQTIEKTVHLGHPQFPNTGNVTGPATVNFNQTKTYTYSGGLPIGADSSYQWYINAPINDAGGPTCAWQILSGQGTPTITVKTGCIAATAAIDVRVTNSCGSDSRYMYVTNSATGTGGGGGIDPCAPIINTFPNPIASNNSLTISLTAPDPCDVNAATTSGAARTAGTNNEVKIYDFYGNVKYTNSFTTDEMTLNNINLPKGHYILNVFTSTGKTVRKVIMVE